MKTFFPVDNVTITDRQLFLIAGPCVIENESLTMRIAETAKKICQEIEIPFIFKASFDKANRSSIHSFRGPGLDQGLKILARVKKELDLPVLSDIHEPRQAKTAAEVLSIIQIPAFLCRQTDLLQAAGETDRPINIKKGQFMSPEDMAQVVKKVEETGNPKIMLTERGTFFGYNNLVVDFRSIPIMKNTGCPVIIDASHSVQRPAADGIASGGDPQYIPLIAAAGVATGVNGLFLEIHPEPENALSDAKNSLNIKLLKPLLLKLKKMYNCLL